MSLAKRFKLTDNTIRLIVFIVILAVFVIINPDVVSFANIISFCNNMVYNGLLAMALMMLFVMGILDLAVTGYGIFGAYATIVICMKFFMGINIWLMMLMSAVIGALCAMCTGYVIYKFKLPGILVSVAAGNIFTMALFLEGSGSGNVPATVLPPDWMSYNNINLYQASLGTMTVRLHFSVLILFAVIFAVWFYTKKTVEGRSIYAIGGNTEAAVRMGIDFRKTYLMTFAFAGFIAGLAIMMEYMRGAKCKSAGCAEIMVMPLCSRYIRRHSARNRQGRLRIGHSDWYPDDYAHQDQPDHAGSSFICPDICHRSVAAGQRCAGSL